MIVLDASAGLELVLVTETGARVAERSDARLAELPEARIRIELLS